ncbi:MAG: hypothetical protein CL844_05320 [Crocinitomicaceae bacterium]|nr:hypothetical protein [Crocinitomicaceae bacterium]|tara:strand:- start:21594 stop:22718 length:1125 start_codon:yes stop_codon:yes gene_type:complete
MKKYLFILFLTPLLSIAQKKKDLQETIIKYQDSVFNLKNDIQVRNVQEDILNKEISKIKLELENSKTENESLTKDKNRISNNMKILSEDLNKLEKNKQDNIKEINLLQEEISQYKDSLTAQEEQYQLLLNQKESNENEENVRQKKAKHAFDIHIEKTKNQNKQTSNNSDNNDIPIFAKSNNSASNSKFSKSNINGTWDLNSNRTIVTNNSYTYGHYDNNSSNMFFINPSNLSNRKVWSDSDKNYRQEYIQKQMQKKEQKKFFINKLSFIKPNICTIELISGETITTIYELVNNKIGEQKGPGCYSIKYINTDKNEFYINISKYNSSYYYTYEYRNLVGLFDYSLEDFQDLRIKGVEYGDYKNFTDDYGLMGFLK